MNYLEVMKELLKSLKKTGVLNNLISKSYNFYPAILGTAKQTTFKI